MNSHKKTKLIFFLFVILMLAGCGSTSVDTMQSAPTEAASVSQVVATRAHEQAAVGTERTQIDPTGIAANATAAADVPVEPTPNNTATTSSAGVASGSSVQEAIIAALRTQAAAHTFHGLSTTVGASKPATMTIEVVRPDRMRTIIEVGTFRRETINIGQTSYTQTAKGWLKADSPGDLTALPTLNLLFADQSQVDTFVADNKDNWANARLTGTEIVNGKSTKVYEFAVKVTTLMGDQTTNASTPLKLWIGEADNLPYRLQSSAQLNVNGNDVTSTTTFSFYDYNADITIDVPAPIVTP